MRAALKRHAKLHYETYITVTNLMIALSTGVFAMLGVLSTYLSVPVLIVNAVIFGVVLAVGKYGNEQLEDLIKVEEMEKSHVEVCSSGSTGIAAYTGPPR